MFLELALLVAAIDRTAPLAAEGVPGLTFQASPGFWGGGIQIGRIQVCQWSASTTKTPQEIAKGLGAWKRTSDYNFTFERKIGKVIQHLNLNESVADSGKKLTSAHLTEYPPEDGSIPADWPSQYRKGLYRILPDQIDFLRGQEPTRIGRTLSPSGTGAEATYWTKLTLSQADAALRKQFPTWKRVDARREIAYSALGPNPVYQRVRRMVSVGLREADGRTRVVVRWAPGAHDSTSSAPSRLATVDAKPSLRLPAALGTSFGKAKVLSRNASGSTLSWDVALPLSISVLEKKLVSQGAQQQTPKGISEVRHFMVKGKAHSVGITLQRGRIEVRKSIPKGWRATLDVAGFVDHVVVDEGSWTRVSIVQSPITTN